MLVTRFETKSGARLTLTDAIVVDGPEPAAEHELVRMIECDEGDAVVEIEFDPKPEFAQRGASTRDGALGLRASAHGGAFTFRGDLGPITMRRGDRKCFSITFDREGPAVLPVLDRVPASFDRTIAWWQAWAKRARYQGPYRNAVVRSALALKLLAFAPSGAVLAAPTTSLPESIPGDLNWDYRYCWLRDASLTVRALHGLGYQEEATAFCSWLLHTTRLTRPELKPLYDVYGRSRLRERTLDHLHGFAGAKPVRIGNHAVDQLQLDVYGEVLDGVVRTLSPNQRFDRETEKMIAGFGEYVRQHWLDPDAGIWEPRSAPANHTHSVALCWVALDRLLQAAGEGLLRLPKREELEVVRDAIKQAIEREGFSEARGAYVSTFKGKDLDASMLLFPFYGLDKADSPKMKSTYARIVEELSPKFGLVYRYAPAAREGAFGACCFWAVEYLARGGGADRRSQTHVRSSARVRERCRPLR